MTEAENQAMETQEKVPDDDRKVFVGGLAQDCKESDLREHFAVYGEIETINVKTDPNTGRSRGFAFVVFKEMEGVDKAVAVSEHSVKSKKVAVKKAEAKQGKVYVGKLNTDVSEEDLRNHFSTYGAIANIEQPFDKTKNEKKNFCFITFEREDPAKKLLKEGTTTIKGNAVDIKKVTPKPDPRMGGGFGGGRGGRGGGQQAWGGQAWGGFGMGGQQWGGYGGGYGDFGYGGQWAGDAWGGMGGYGGGFGGQAGGKAQRGRGGGRGGNRGGANRGNNRQKPY